MTITGYSDRINHALAFAAKHHDQQVRKGTRLPYLTHPANVAIILTKYQQDDATVVAGILHDVIEDCVREAYSREMLEQRIGDKFGDEILGTVLAVTHRRVDDVLGLRFADFLVRQRHHLTEREREVEGRMCNRTEVRVGARLAGLVVGNDREVNLLALRSLVGHRRQY